MKKKNKKKKRTRKKKKMAKGGIFGAIEALINVIIILLFVVMILYLVKAAYFFFRLDPKSECKDGSSKSNSKAKTASNSKKVASNTKSKGNNKAKTVGSSNRKVGSAFNRIEKGLPKKGRFESQSAYEKRIQRNQGKIIANQIQRNAKYSAKESKKLEKNIKGIEDKKKWSLAGYRSKESRGTLKEQKEAKQEKEQKIKERQAELDSKKAEIQRKQSEQMAKATELSNRMKTEEFRNLTPAQQKAERKKNKEEIDRIQSQIKEEQTALTKQQKEQDANVKSKEKYDKEIKNKEDKIKKKQDVKNALNSGSIVAEKRSYSNWAKGKERELSEGLAPPVEQPLPQVPEAPAGAQQPGEIVGAVAPASTLPQAPTAPPPVPTAEQSAAATTGAQRDAVTSTPAPADSAALQTTQSGVPNASPSDSAEEKAAKKAAKKAAENAEKKAKQAAELRQAEVDAAKKTADAAANAVRADEAEREKQERIKKEQELKEKLKDYIIKDEINKTPIDVKLVIKDGSNDNIKITRDKPINLNINLDDVNGLDDNDKKQINITISQDEVKNITMSKIRKKIIDKLMNPQLDGGGNLMKTLNIINKHGMRKHEDELSLMIVEENILDEIQSRYKNINVKTTNKITHVIRKIFKNFGKNIKGDKLDYFTEFSENFDEIYEKLLDVFNKIKKSKYKTICKTKRSTRKNNCVNINFLLQELSEKQLYNIMENLLYEMPSMALETDDMSYLEQNIRDRIRENL